MAETITDEHGDSWVPEGPITPPPIFVWPPQPVALAKFLFGYPGFLFPWNAMYIALAVFSWYVLTPSLAAMETLEAWWIAAIFARNYGLLLIVTGGYHLRFYILGAQGKKYMFNRATPQAENRRFLFGRQVWDNMFWSVASGCTLLAIYECATLWALANGVIPYLDPQIYPVLFVLWFFLLPLFRDVHFYAIHRLLHIPYLYRKVHYLHHKNVDIGPWTGISMHPVEHAIFFSTMIIHWTLASHPIHIIWHAQNLILGPALGHLGYGKMALKGGGEFPLGQRYFHYLHHKHFECNYGGDSSVPIDKWVGSFHDGTAESQARIRERIIRMRRKQNSPKQNDTAESTI